MISLVSRIARFGVTLLSATYLVWWLLLPLHGQSTPLRYGDWMAAVLRGDLGESLFNGKPVVAHLHEAFPLSLQLFLMALVLGLAFAAALGFASAKAGTWRRGIDGFAALGSTLPSFVLGIFLAFLGWFIFGTRPAESYAGGWQENLVTMLVPALALAIPLAATLVPPVQRPRAMLAAAVARSGLAVISVLSGLVVVEKIFGIPGLGNLLVRSASFGDYPVLLPIALIAAVAGSVLILLSDLLRQPARASTPLFADRRRVLRHPATRAGLGLVGLGLLIALLGPWISPDPSRIDLASPLGPPGPAGWLGTDMYGRDALALLIHGTGSALLAGIIPCIVALLPGVLLGLCAGYCGRRGGALGAVDIVVTGFTDVMLAFPFLVLALVLASVAGGGTTTAMAAIGISAAAIYARLIRDHVIGGGTRRDLAGMLVVQTALCTAVGIAGYAALSMLGEGAVEPAPSWGNMIAAPMDALMQGPWIAVSVGTALTLSILSFTLIATGTRSALARIR